MKLYYLSGCNAPPLHHLQWNNHAQKYRQKL